MMIILSLRINIAVCVFDVDVASCCACSQGYALLWIVKVRLDEVLSRSRRAVTPYLPWLNLAFYVKNLLPSSMYSLRY